MCCFRRTLFLTFITITAISDSSSLEKSSNSDLRRGESLEGTSQSLSPIRTRRKSLLSEAELKEQLILAKVNGLKRRFKRFACWHSCIGSYYRKIVQPSDMVPAAFANSPQFQINYEVDATTEHPNGQGDYYTEYEDGPPQGETGGDGTGQGDYPDEGPPPEYSIEYEGDYPTDDETGDSESIGEGTGEGDYPDEAGSPNTEDGAGNVGDYPVEEYNGEDETIGNGTGEGDYPDEAMAPNNDGNENSGKTRRHLSSKGRKVVNELSKDKPKVRKTSENKKRSNLPNSFIPFANNIPGSVQKHVEIKKRAGIYPNGGDFEGLKKQSEHVPVFRR